MRQLKGAALFSFPRWSPGWCHGRGGQYGQYGPRPPPTRDLRRSSILSKPRSQVPRRPDDVLTISRPHRGTCLSPESPEPSVCAQRPIALCPGSQAPLGASDHSLPLPLSPQPRHCESVWAVSLETHTPLTWAHFKHASLQRASYLQSQAAGGHSTTQSRSCGC